MNSGPDSCTVLFFFIQSLSFGVILRPSTNLSKSGGGSCFSISCRISARLLVEKVERSIAARARAGHRWARHARGEFDASGGLRKIAAATPRAAAIVGRSANSSSRIKRVAKGSRCERVFDEDPAKVYSGGKDLGTNSRSDWVFPPDDTVH